MFNGGVLWSGSEWWGFFPGWDYGLGFRLGLQTSGSQFIMCQMSSSLTGENTCLSMDKINMIHKALHNTLHIYAFQTANRIDESVAVKFNMSGGGVSLGLVCLIWVSVFTSCGYFEWWITSSYSSTCAMDYPHYFHSY